jgi:hypothetical protein
MVKVRVNPSEADSPTAQEAKDAICDLIAAAGGVFYGKVRLHKAFYFAHLFYWRDGEGVLTSHPVVRLPQGPFIDDGERLISELRRDGMLTIGSVPVGPYQETVYKLATERSVETDTPRGRAIRQAVDLVVNRSAVELSDLTHEYSLSWQQTENGREMDIYIDLLDDEHLAQIRREIATLRQSQESDV